MIETMNPADLGSMGLIADDPFISDDPVGMPSLSDALYGFDPSELANRIFRLLKRYIGATDDDLKMLTLWIMHTWVFASLYTTPRLLVTSILPGAGKTTLLEWIGHLGAKSEMLSAISSASLLANLADQGYTLLVDEADRSLRKDNPLAADFIAVVNTGYKKGGSRTIQEPDKKHGWKVVRKSTHAPAVFAGNNPDLPADTRQRCIPVFLYPSDEVEESDWEMIEEDDAEYLDLRHDLPLWAEMAASAIKPRPTLPESVKGRYREVWLPLARIAQTQSGDWLDTVRRPAASHPQSEAHRPMAQQDHHRTQQTRNHRMKDITTNEPMTAPMPTAAVSAAKTQTNASTVSTDQLVQALYEQADAQNRIADQLEKMNDHLSDMSQMLYACLHSHSMSLDGIDRSLGEIAEQVENAQGRPLADRQPATAAR